MELAGIAALLASVGGVLGTIALYLERRGARRGTELELAWEITQDQLTTLRKEKDDLSQRVTVLETEVRRLEGERREDKARLRRVERERDQALATIEFIREMGR